MKYKNAQNLLPDNMLKELQAYVEGEYLYIPIRQDKKKVWGDNTDTKEILRKRNKNIWQEYQGGESLKELSTKYFLTEPSIRRIIRQYKK